MPPYKDLTGQRFGRLLVTGRGQNDNNGNVRWNCKCDCGGATVSYSSSLRNGRAQSCGCIQRETAAQIAKQYRVTHGSSSTRLYRIWQKMKERCESKNSISYGNYGARGIAVCEEWHNFEEFQRWALSNGYTDELSIDRIDNEKGYAPNNCRWVAVKAQANNKRNNRWLTYNGETLTIAQWGERMGISAHVIAQRIFRDKWAVDRALTTPARRRSNEKSD